MHSFLAQNCARAQNSQEFGGRFWRQIMPYILGSSWGPWTQTSGSDPLNRHIDTQTNYLQDVNVSFFLEFETEMRKLRLLYTETLSRPGPGAP